MSMLEKTDIQLGYIPLLDCIALLWASHQGYFAEQGLHVTLVKEPSWASLRDRLAFGLLDAAHCLSAMLPAAATGEDHLGIPLQTSLALSHNRAFISLSQKLCHHLNLSIHDTPLQSSQKLMHAIQQGQDIHLAHVFKQSIHHYILREWLALSDGNIAAQYRFSSLPPPYMVEAISSHLIDGFCVGEPWNTQAEIEGFSRIILSSEDIIPTIPDKVVAFTADWALQHPHTLQALTKAIEKAQQDLKNPAFFDEIWALLKVYEIIRFQCSADIHVQAFHRIMKIIQDFSNPQKPQTTDFEWIIQKMKRWDHLHVIDSELANIAKNCIYRV
ncbi:ABC transporter substrate-binding protein [Acinetobacter sp. B51(2017)]|uniref:ABC transporter substrate-binding protein n=1 Tax=Acinetobacter sp. B51(2017) TaxID=2060938 RepID=UPI000F07DC05|nr:ABC transporter substrate-binding protein [Acinetobacter sp. B51(2017)]